MTTITPELRDALDALTRIDPKDLPQVVEGLRLLVAQLNGVSPLDARMIRTSAILVLTEREVPDARKFVDAAFAERPEPAAGTRPTQPPPDPETLRAAAQPLLAADPLAPVGRYLIAQGYAGDLRPP